MLDSLQHRLDRINARFGAVGSVLTVLFWLVILSLAIWHMIEQA